MTWEVRRGDCIEVMRAMPDASVDAIVCDPPYGLGFMGREWDSLPPGLPWARECLRVLKPGGHLLAFGGTRTYHRLACAVEDAGFEVRDCLAWLYGSGFPKSLDVSKAIDKARNDRPDVLAITTALADAAEAVGVTRADVDAHMGTSDMGGWWLSRLEHRCACPTWDQWLELKALTRCGDALDAEVWRLNGRKGTPGHERLDRVVSGPATNSVFQPTQVVEHAGTPVLPDAERWQGWGTALKPAFEPIVMARKPLTGTVAANVLEHGTGALNVDGCRIAGDEDGSRNRPPSRLGSNATYAQDEWTRNAVVERQDTTGVGRWPANVVLDERAAAMLDEQTGETRDGVAVNRNRTGDKPASVYGQYGVPAPVDVGYGDHGGASRFLYVAKASSAERNAGLDGFPEREAHTLDGGEMIAEGRTAVKGKRTARNVHPTVKPVDLMRWLVRLVTPPNGTVLDPFTGSGTTGIAAVLEGFDFIGVEREAEYADIAEARIQWWADQPEGIDVADTLAGNSVRTKIADTGQLDMLGG